MKHRVCPSAVSQKLTSSAPHSGVAALLRFVVILLASRDDAFRNNIFIVQASLASLGNGVLLFANPATPYGRNMISIKASLDGGRSWRAHLVVERENTFGYTSLVNGFVVKDCLSQVERMLTGILFEASPNFVACSTHSQSLRMCDFPEASEKGDIDYRTFRYNTTRALQARLAQTWLQTQTWTLLRGNSSFTARFGNLLVLVASVQGLAGTHPCWDVPAQGLGAVWWRCGQQKECKVLIAL
eukprot:2738028-Amphidinium_carterae.1